MRAETRAEIVSYEGYRRRSRFPALDGLRAVSILLVLTWHSNSAVFAWLSGWEGVTVFFVLSGYLITTLCLREEADAGRVSIRGFFIRRTFRIAPPYLLVLAVYAVTSLGLDYHHHRHLFAQSLPYYVSFLNDFAPLQDATPFAHSWSLGVEEKFYLAWPFLAFVVWRLHPGRRLYAAALLASLPCFFLPFHIVGHYVAYGSIMTGCLVAIVLHDPRGYRILARFGSGGALFLATAAVIGCHLAVHQFGAGAQAAYPFAVALFMVGLVVGNGLPARALALRPMVWIGRRAYGIYLVHLLVLSVAVAVVRHAGGSFDALSRPDGAHRVVASFAILALGTAGSIVAADLMYRSFERPFIALGHRLSKRAPTPEPVSPPSPPAVAPPPAATLGSLVVETEQAAR